MTPTPGRPPAGPPPPAPAQSARLRSDRAEAIKDAWRAGEPPDAAGALRANPDLAADRAVALDLAYEEFCTRAEAGEVVDSHAFCSRFPFGVSLRRLIDVHRFLDAHPDALGPLPPVWPDPGQAVGDFVVVRELGRGGFSRVYLGVETSAGGRPVALKVSAAGSREADTLGPLSHPHLIPVLSARQIGPWAVVAMPFVGTATLEDLLAVVRAAGPAGRPGSAAAVLEAASRGGRPEDPPFPSRPAYPVLPGMTYEDGIAAVAAGLLAAVAHLHGRGVAHRDLKPSNVLLGPTGYPYLLDLNLAAAGPGPWRLAGTVPYMAPEQLCLLADPGAAAPADWRPADVFALGVILYELLAGRHPFGDAACGGAGLGELVASLAGAQRAGPPPLAAANPRVGRALRAAVERCLATEPGARPTAAELARLVGRERRGLRRFLLPALVGLLAFVLAYPPPREPVTSPGPPSPEAAPNDPFGRGVLLARQGQHALAAGEFLEAGRAGKDGRAFAMAAYCLSVERAHTPAILAAEEAIRLGHRTAPVFANRAYSRLKLGRLPEAKSDCDEALRLDPELRAARLTRAVVYYRLYEQTGAAIPPEALEDIDRVTAGGPNTPDVWMTAAHLYVLTAGGSPGARDRAAAAVREAVLAGKDPAAVRRNPVLTPSLAGHPVFEAALVLGPRVLPPAVHDPHVVNPIP